MVFLRILTLYVKRFKIQFVAILLIIFALGLRIFFVPYGVQLSGDFQLFMDWGQKFWEVGAQNFYYHKIWTLAPPNYPPTSSLIFGFSYWLFDHKYILAQLHNLIKIPPAAFIIYFYKYGYILLLKLPSILSDLGIAYLIYKIILKISEDKKRAYFGFFFFLLNPVAIFLSSVWGQTDSLVSFLGLLSFFLLLNKRFEYSMITLFVSLYTKPNWIYLTTFYFYVLFKMKPNLGRVLIGILASFLIYLSSTLPFAGSSLISFTLFFVKERLIASALGAELLSSSAFNFYTIFFDIYKHSSTKIIFGIPGNIFAWVMYVLLNIVAINFFNKHKNKLLAAMVGIYLIGFGTYLFMTNMLERYFFAAFPALIVLAFTNPKLILWTLILNLNVFLNIVWAFFRRRYDEIGQPFTNNNFLLIRIISFASLFSWFRVIIELGLAKTFLRRG